MKPEQPEKSTQDLAEEIIQRHRQEKVSLSPSDDSLFRQMRHETIERLDASLAEEEGH